MSLKNSSDTIGNRTRDLPVCSKASVNNNEGLIFLSPEEQKIRIGVSVARVKDN